MEILKNVFLQEKTYCRISLLKTYKIRQKRTSWQVWHTTCLIMNSAIYSSRQRSTNTLHYENFAQLKNNYCQLLWHITQAKAIISVVLLFYTRKTLTTKHGFQKLLGNSTVTELQVRYFGLLFNHFVLYSYDLSQFEYFYMYMVQRYQCHYLNHKICQISLMFRDQRGGICDSVTELPENWAKFFSWE